MRAADAMEVIEPTPDDVRAARRSVRALAEAAGAVAGESAHGVVELESVQIPEAALPLLVRVVEEMARGNAVAVYPVVEEPLSTTEAAAMLHVSRPTLVHLLEAGEIDFHRVGTHRRVSRASLLAYRRRTQAAGRGEHASREDRLRAVREVIRLGEDAGEPH